MAYATLAELKSYLKIRNGDTFTADASSDQLTVAHPTKVPWTTGNAVEVTNSGGALPSPLATDTVYYVIRVSDSVLKLATTAANAAAGTAIDLTDAGNGTQTVTMAVTDDDLLADFLARAQAIVEARPPLGTGRVFEWSGAASDRNFDAVEDTDGPTLWLDEDCCEITAITDGDGDTISSDDYVTEPRNETPYYAVTLKRGSGEVWEYEDSPEDAIAVTAKWSYSTTPPADVVHATLRLAAWLYRQQSSGGEGDRTMITPDGTKLLPSALPRDVRDVIESYRRLV